MNWRDRGDDIIAEFGFGDDSSLLIENFRTAVNDLSKKYIDSSGEKTGFYALANEVRSELGDVMLSLAALASILGVDLDLALDEAVTKKRKHLAQMGLWVPIDNNPDTKGLVRLLDGKGKVVRWPKKSAERRLVISYLATKFSVNFQYSEKEINEILNKYHTFGDWALLRRELYEQGYLGRTQNGSSYWRISAREESNHHD